jgi:hypothetical protein
MKTKIALSIGVFALFLSVCANAQVKSDQAYKTTTVLGTWAWNVESDRLCKSEDGDFWWERVDANSGYIVPLNGAEAAVVTGKDFETIDAKSVQKAALSKEKIASETLKPGAIVIFRTGKGEVGKFQVVGYKSSHNFDFPEAKHLTDKWKKFTLSKPESPAYHLQVKWGLLH